MPPRRSSATARAAAATAARAAAAVAATPMTTAVVEKLIEARVSAALANHETLRNTANGVVVLSQWFEKMESVFHISNCAMENQVKLDGTKEDDDSQHCLRGEIKKLEIEL
ncbi:hypothetical protein Tco_0834747 [Tanacetum coccineum]